jgi:hypothetical protein
MIHRPTAPDLSPGLWGDGRCEIVKMCYVEYVISDL